MASLRNATLVWLTMLLTLVGAVAVVISYKFAESEANGFLDALLHQIALNVGPSLGDPVALANQHDPEDELVIQIWSLNGERLQSSHPEIDVPRQSDAGFTNLYAAGEEWRSYQLTEPHRTVQVSQRMQVRSEIAEHAAVHAAAPILVVIPLSWLLLGWALTNLSGRLTNLARIVGERGTDSRKPIPVEGIPREVAPLVEAMNTLIARLQASLDRQREFVGEAAHALRTPLTALRLQIENLEGQVTGNARTRLSDLAVGSRRATTLVDQLLAMARYDSVPEQPERGPIEIVDLVKDCVADQVVLAERKGIDLGITDQQHGTIHGSSHELRMLFANLIDNAVRYTPAKGTIDISIRRTETGMVVEIADTGCGIPEELLPKIFDRFVRAAASGAVDGSGLGLAIVKAIADRHGIRVTLANRQGGTGAIARVVFPQ